MLSLVIFIIGGNALGALAVPQSGSCKNSASSPCSLTGTDATYQETIVGEQRRMTSSGCPNNNPVTICIGDNPNPASKQDWTFEVPATPQFHAGNYQDSLAAAVPLHKEGGLIGMTVNGVEVRACWGGSTNPTCVDYDASATKIEGDTFEYCGGHGNPYHYHQAPICLLQQMGARSDNSSKIVGWAADGFPMYGNRGPGGVLIRRCGTTGADATYCADECGGYWSEDYDDDFKYRYFLMGSDEISESNPVPMLGAEFFPFAPLCLLGCGAASASGTDKSPTIGDSMKACGGSASAGTKADYTPTLVAGVTSAFSPTYGSWASGETYTPTPAPSASSAKTAVEAPFACVLVVFLTLATKGGKAW